MKELTEKGYALFLIDGIYKVEEVKIIEQYDEEKEGAKEIAQQRIDSRMEKLSEKSLDTCFRYTSGYVFNLFGGRVEARNISECSLKIDGIYIKIPSSQEPYMLFSRLDEVEMWSFVNIIGKVGVDSFFENYKKTVLDQYDRLTEKLRKLEDLYAKEGSLEKNSPLLIKYWNDLKDYQILIFHLLLWMMPGIENETMVNVSDKVNNILALV